ncbi:MAG: hypothetical protein WCA35_07700 [Kovacikia sp.]
MTLKEAGPLIKQLENRVANTTGKDQQIAKGLLTKVKNQAARLRAQQ